VVVVKTHTATVLHIITKEAFSPIKITVISHVIKAPSFIVTSPNSSTCEVTCSVFCYYSVFFGGQDVGNYELRNGSSYYV
jgi:hypothetical protein